MVASLPSILGHNSLIHFENESIWISTTLGSGLGTVRHETDVGKTNEGQAICNFGKLEAVAGEKYIPFHTVIDFFQIPTIINCSGGFPAKFGSAESWWYIRDLATV